MLGSGTVIIALQRLLLGKRDADLLCTHRMMLCSHRMPPVYASSSRIGPTILILLRLMIYADIFSQEREAEV